MFTKPMQRLVHIFFLSPLRMLSVTRIILNITTICYEALDAWE